MITAWPSRAIFVCLFFVVRIVVISQFNFFLVAAVACHGYSGRPMSELKNRTVTSVLLYMTSRLALLTALLQICLCWTGGHGFIIQSFKSMNNLALICCCCCYYYYYYYYYYLYCCCRCYSVRENVYYLRRFSVLRVFRCPAGINRGCQVISGLRCHLGLTDHLASISWRYRSDARQDEFRL